MDVISLSSHPKTRSEASVVDTALLDAVTSGAWPVVHEIAPDGMWPTSTDLTLILLCPVLGDAAALLLQLMAVTDQRKLTTGSIADRYGISRGAVRCALAKLSDAGFAQIVDGAIIVPDRIGPLNGSVREALPSRLGAVHDSLASHSRHRA